EIIGSIALLEAPKGMAKEAKQAASEILKAQKNIKSVYQKIGSHEGKLRIQKLKRVLGERGTITTHKENGITLKLDVAKVYFSPRQATERKRVYEQVKKPERVLVMFSGIGPFAIAMAKNTPAVQVYGVELNKTSHKYAVENARINKVEAKTKLFCGDVRKIVPKLGKFDRLLMPLPKGAERFLDVAFAAAKKGCIMHFYDFEKEEDIPQKAIGKITTAAAKSKRKIRTLNVVKCGQLAPRAYRVCVDFLVN
ncbi:MAG: class I SAM-dependent methyltransferase family protein, partial [Nanoarchaeota archaeon]